MRIRMLETRRECEDGHRVQEFCAGQEYDVAEMAACRLLNTGAAEFVAWSDPSPYDDMLAAYRRERGQRQPKEACNANRHKPTLFLRSPRRANTGRSGEAA